MRPGYRAAALIGAGTLYAVAFFLPAANPYYDPVDPKFRPWPGYKPFQLGWHLLTHWKQEDPFAGLQMIAVTGWMANPAIWLAFGAAALRRWWWARLFAALGAALALSLLPFPKFADALAGQPGYWAWTGSAVVLLVVGWWGWRANARHPLS